MNFNQVIRFCLAHCFYVGSVVVWAQDRAIELYKLYKYIYLCVYVVELRHLILLKLMNEAKFRCGKRTVNV